MCFYLSMKNWSLEFIPLKHEIEMDVKEMKCYYIVSSKIYIISEKYISIIAKRFTEEQKNVLNGIRMFLEKDATN